MTERALQLGEAFASWIPFIGFLWQVYGSAKKLRHALDLGIKPSASEVRPDEAMRRLKATLREEAARRPLVHIVDAVEEAEGSWWPWFLNDLSPDIASGLRLVIVLAIDGPSALGEHEEGEPTELFLARRMVRREIAEWVPVKVPTREDFRSWLRNADPRLVDLLYSTSAGDADAALELWADWAERGLVHRPDRDTAWRLAPQKETEPLSSTRDVLNVRLKMQFQDDLKAVAQAYDVLRCCALEGPVFTADAVAGALDWDRDLLIDYLDDHLADEGPTALLKDHGAVTVSSETSIQRQLWTYRFGTEAYRWALAQDLEAAERALLSKKLADALRRLYFPEEHRVAGSLARLYAAAGDAEAARHFREVVNHETNLGLLRWQAKQTIEDSKAGWTKWDYAQATSLLVRAAHAMEHSCPRKETLGVWEEARRAAVEAENRAQQAIALLGKGRCEFELGHDTRSSTRTALQLAQATGHREAELKAWLQLGFADLRDGLYAASRQKAMHALPLAKDMGSRDGEANAWHLLGCSDFNAGHLHVAKSNFIRALEIERKLGRRGGEAANLHQIASIEFELGELESARDRFRQCLPIAREAGEREGESSIWNQLGRVAVAMGEHTDARTSFEQALVIARDLDDEEKIGVNLVNLGVLDLMEGNLDRASESLILAIRMAQKLGDVQLEALIFHQLGLVRLKQDPDGEITLVILALWLSRRLGNSHQPVVERDLDTIRAERGITDDDLVQLLDIAAGHYAKDKGWSLVTRG